MSLLAHLMRRLGYIRLTDYGLGLRPDGRLVSLAGSGDLHGLELAGDLPTEGFDVRRLLGEPAIAAAVAAPRTRAARATPPPVPSARAAEDDWERVVAEAKARAEALDATPTIAGAPALASPAISSPAALAPTEPAPAAALAPAPAAALAPAPAVDDDDGEEDWERLVAEAKARADEATAIAADASDSADEITRHEDDRSTRLGDAMIDEPPTRVEPARVQPELCLDETTGGVPTRVVALPRDDEFVDEAPTNAVRRAPTGDEWSDRVSAATARAEADEERRRRAAREARRLAQRPRRPTLPTAPRARAASRADGAAPASRLAVGTRPPQDSEDTVTTVAVRPSSKRAPLRPAPRGDAPLPRLTARLGKQPTGA